MAAQSCPTLSDPVDCSPPGSSVHGILRAGILEWVAMPSSRGSSRPRDRTWVFCIDRQILHRPSDQGSPICSNNMPLSPNNIRSNRIVYSNMIFATIFHIIIFCEMTVFSPVITQTKEKTQQVHSSESALAAGIQRLANTTLCWSETFSKEHTHPLRGHRWNTDQTQVQKDVAFYISFYSLRFFNILHF